jgi:hypothetical protein
MAQTGFTPISIYYSSTATNVPTAGNLVAGELAINTADGKLFYKDSAGVVQVIGTKGGVGSSTTTQVLYNSSGLVVGSANMTFSGTALTLANDASISGLTVGKGGGAVATNTAIGSSTLSSNTTGNSITAIGYQAGQTNSTGSSGAFIGAYAGQLATGANNTALGYSALSTVTNPSTGTSNVAIGVNALTFNSSGSQNTAVGMQALQQNTTASNNTAVGYQAGYSYNSGSANGITALGYQALYSTTTDSSTAVGTKAAYSTTSGYYIVAMGREALYSNTSGTQNVAIGDSALRGNTTASNNTALGYQAGIGTTTAQYNVFVGSRQGSSGNGEGNTIIGDFAGNARTSGIYNTFVGQSSGYLMTTGSKNTIIGGYSGNNGGLDIRTASNWIVLSDGDGNPRARWSDVGAAVFRMSATDTYSFDTQNAAATRPYGVNIQFSGASPNNTSQTFLDCQDTTNTKLTIYSNGTVSNRTGTYNTLSDAKLKENIVDATPKLDKLMDVKVRNYNLIGDELKQIGFVAQELETIFPALIDNVADLDENKQPTGEVTKGVKLTVMIPILVKAIQELKAEFDAYKATHP